VLAKYDAALKDASIWEAPQKRARRGEAEK
jgi:hypothetical protein